MTRTETARRALLAAALVVVTTVPATAQLAGENLLGDFGARSGTQPHPGLYTSLLYYRYDTGTITDRHGDAIQIPGGAEQTINAVVPVLTYVLGLKLFGANVGMTAVVPIASGSIEAPGLGLYEEAESAFGDIYLMPLQLGWHFDRADAVAGIALFAPTGRYEAGADDNIGRGMWTYELSAGGTLYLDEARRTSIAATAFWELHSRKEGEVAVAETTLDDVRVGQILTVEGGLARTFLRGAASIGSAWYAQWKVTADDLGTGAALDLPGHRVFGIGPDVTVPIAVKSRLLALVNARYLWETGAAVHTEGSSLLITATVPFGRSEAH